jgi:hypothetical protein
MSQAWTLAPKHPQVEALGKARRVFGELAGVLCSVPWEGGHCGNGDAEPLWAEWQWDTSEEEAELL